MAWLPRPPPRGCVPPSGLPSQAQVGLPTSQASWVWSGGVFGDVECLESHPNSLFHLAQGLSTGLAWGPSWCTCGLCPPGPLPPPI